jgi:hypothetical protein
MTKMEKALTIGLNTLFEKIINLEDTQIAMAKLLSVSIICDAKQKRILQTAIARAESSSDQMRAAVEKLKAISEKF